MVGRALENVELLDHSLSSLYNFCPGLPLLPLAAHGNNAAKRASAPTSALAPPPTIVLVIAVPRLQLHGGSAEGLDHCVWHH